MEEGLLSIDQSWPGPWALSLDLLPCSDNVSGVVRATSEHFHSVALVPRVALEWGGRNLFMESEVEVGQESLSSSLGTPTPSDKCIAISFSSFTVLGSRIQPQMLLN
jgi:hypothetical protein